MPEKIKSKERTTGKKSPKKRFGVVSCTKLNVRSGSWPNAPVIRIAKKNEKFEILSEKSHAVKGVVYKYYEIKIDDENTAYVDQRFVDAIE